MGRRGFAARAHGSKTSVSVRVATAGGGLVAQLAHGSCARPTALTSTTVLGELTSPVVSWTVPTPYAQLAASRVAVILRSAAHAVESCGVAR